MTSSEFAYLKIYSKKLQEIKYKDSEYSCLK